VHVTTKSYGRSFYAYVAYDGNFTGTVDGKRHIAAHFAVVKIDNEASPSTVASRVYPPSSARFDAFGSTATASVYSGAVGWFYYSQEDAFGNSAPCATTYQGQTTTGGGVSGTWIGHLLDSGFPTVSTSGQDYVGIVKRGLPGGNLFPSWHREVVTSGSGPGCLSCLGTTYTSAIYGEQVIP
jgi:hypothetical protein